MKSKVIDILTRHPEGLKARQSAALLPNADRRTVNQILYDNPSEFMISSTYIWKLTQAQKTYSLSKKPSISCSKPSHPSKKMIQQILWDYFDISYLEDNAVEQKMYSLNMQDFNRFAENIKLICKENYCPHIIKKDRSIAASCAELALLKPYQFQKIISKSKQLYNTVGKLSFHHWHQLVSMPEAEFNSLMLPPVRFQAISNLPSRRTDQNWDWITFTAYVIQQDKFLLFEHNNMRLYHLSPKLDESVLSYDTWKRIVLLPEKEFEREIQLLKAQKLDAQRSVARDLERSERDKQKQRLRQFKEQELIASMHSNYPQQIIAKKCIGDCSTCTRSECIDK